MLLLDEVDTLHKLFEVVKLFTLSAGGDGDGWVISERYRELANLFLVRENSTDPWFIERIDEENQVSFCHRQESINFIKTEGQLPSWAGDIIVRIP